jgi:hypothetical protein
MICPLSPLINDRGLSSPQIYLNYIQQGKPLLWYYIMKIWEQK